MPTMMLSFKKISSGWIMFHGFLAPSERDAEKDLDGHASVCPQFGPAHKAGETIDVAVDVDDLPEFSEDSIQQWLDDLLGLDDEDDEDEDDDLEDDEEEEAEEDVEEAE
jgi:hypothetical protein